jgi:hypothetical protein
MLVAREELTNPWKNTKENAATLVRFLNSDIGISGYFANRFSL